MHLINDLTMDHEEGICDWPSYDGSQPQTPDLSSSEDEESQVTNFETRSHLRPAGSALAFVPYANWEPERSYDSQLVIHWNMEWKISVKNRERAGESELNIVISPRKFWKHILQSKVTAASTDKPWKKRDTKLVLSVTDRKTGKIQKRYPDNIDWLFIATQICEWSTFVKGGKKITVALTFYYDIADTDTTRSGRGGATANQLADLDARTIGRGRVACAKEAYSFAECRKRSSCTNGSDHCVDLDGKHLRVLPHHIGILVNHLQDGKSLKGYDDLPLEFRRLVLDDARQREERERKEQIRSRKRRRGSECSIQSLRLIECPCAPTHGSASNAPSTPRMVFPTSRVIELDLRRDEAVREYKIWQKSQVSSDDQKQQYDKAEDLTLAHGYDLSVIVVNQERMHRFYTEHGVLDGVAWHWVCDVKAFVKHLTMDDGI